MAHEPYVKTVYVNDSAPAISAENLNKSENELTFLDTENTNINEALFNDNGWLSNALFGVYEKSKAVLYSDTSNMNTGYIKTNGTFNTTDANWRYSDEIEITEGTVIICKTYKNSNSCQAAVYDSNHNCIAQYIADANGSVGNYYTNFMFFAPTASKYVRFTFLVNPIVSASIREKQHCQILYPYADYKNIENEIQGIISGERTGLYDINTLISTISSWVHYDTVSSCFTIGTDSINLNHHIGANGSNSFFYKVNPFTYVVGNHLRQKVKIRVNSFNISSNTQRVTFEANNYIISSGSEDIWACAVEMKTDGSLTYGVVHNGNFVSGTSYSGSFPVELEIPLDIGITNVNSANKFICWRTSNYNEDNFDIDLLEWKIWVDDGTPGSKEGVLGIEYAERSNISKYTERVYSEIVDKTWGAVGDSLTASYFDLYVSYIADKLDLTATNLGIGGTCIANTESADATPSFVDRICGLHGQTGYSDDKDIWTIFGGTNDCLKSVPIGTISDTSDTTFYGALNLICECFSEFPSHPLVAFIIPYNINNAHIKDYADAIEAVCEKWGFPVLNLMKLSGINPSNRSYYLRDGVHPTQEGANKVRPLILKWFEDLSISVNTPDLPH